MSVFDGEIDFRTVHRVEYTDKSRPPFRVPNPSSDDCLIVGIGRDALKVTEDQKDAPVILCPKDSEYYKTAVERIKQKYPRIWEKYMQEDLDPVPIQHEIQDLKRTEYLVKYCSRDLPFMSINLARRAKALQTIHLPDDTEIPATTHGGSFRHPPPDKYVEHPSKQSLRPKYDDTLKKKLRRILRVQTGSSMYTFKHGLLGDVIKENNPFGPPREEPNYGRWKSRYMYTFRL